MKMSAQASQPRLGIYLGLFLVTLATLQLEILLTRIFSATLWYHFAFMALSIAMFGMTAGAMVVYLRPDWFPADKLDRRLGTCSLLFAFSTVAALLIHLWLPFEGITFQLLTFLAVTIPFTWSGICVSLILTRFPGHVGKLYAADLIGAALGCIAVILTLELVDGISAVFVVATLAAAGALGFWSGTGRRRLITAALCALGFAAIAVLNPRLGEGPSPWLHIRWTKGDFEGRLLDERWNSFSRVTVHRDAPTKPVGWGLSPTFKPRGELEQLWLRMDSHAGTLLTRFEGDFSTVEHLRYDITNLAHYLRSPASVLVIGAGGGRDVLAALAFGQKEIVAVELNGDTLDLVNGKYGEFTGHLDRYPQVSFVLDEARSYIARQDRRFDIIQASWIDTWAATAAGAFVLSENSLYTIDAWKNFLEHLEPGGMLSFTRFYSERSPWEAARLMALGRAALVAVGAEDPQEHLAMIVTVDGGSQAPVIGNATLLVSRDPLRPEDVETLRATSERLAFKIAYLPGDEPLPLFSALATGRSPAATETSSRFRLDAPTDNNPFFFNMMHLRTLLDGEVWQRYRGNPNLRALSNLLLLLAIVTVLTVVCFLPPLLVGRHRHRLGRRDIPFLLFFTAIGLGFMLVEVAQMQRLIIFLGHPTYSLSVVLFSLLLAGGLGSWLSEKLGRENLRRDGMLALGAIVVAVGFAGLLTPWLAQAFADAGTPVRITVAAVSIAAIGVLMGMAFPLGLRAAARQSPGLTPWLWGLNGAASVCASVLAVALSLEAGIAVSNGTGTVCYLLAFLAFLTATRQPS